MNLLQLINNISDRIEDYYLNIKHTIHENPELSFKEYNTAKLVRSELERMGIPYERSPVETGTIALIDSGKEGKLLMLRADMDALPMQESGKHPYSSKVANVMHSCGHDAHTANLLAVAEVLNSTKEHWTGRIKLVFQPAEENGGGGREMIKAGLMEEVPDACFALHVSPEPIGTIRIAYGNATSYSDGIGIVIKGKAGHSSTPQVGVDAIQIASAIIPAIYNIQLKNISPMSRSTINIGTIKGGTAANIIADQVEMSAMMRNSDKESRQIFMDKIPQVVKGIAESYGGSAEITLKEGYSSVYNDPKLSAQVADLLESNKAKLLEGIPEAVEGNIYTGDQFMLGGEDFGFYTEIAPSCFIFIGTGGGVSMHHPDFHVKDQSVKLCTRTMALMAMDFMQ